MDENKLSCGACIRLVGKGTEVEMENISKAGVFYVYLTRNDLTRMLKLMDQNTEEKP